MYTRSYDFLCRRNISLEIDEKILIIIFVLTNIVCSSYISVGEASKKWGITERRIQILCNEGRIDSVMRVGKVWMIPEDAQKPSDARLKRNEGRSGDISHKMRLLLKHTIHQLFDDNKSSDLFLTMQQALSYYTAFLLRIYNSRDIAVLGSDELDFVEMSMKNIYCDYERIPNDYNTQAIDQQAFSLIQNKDFLTDSLSWAYQYLKQYCPNDLTSTQFFTERYMISTLVDEENIGMEDIIVDPSCGGGNFLMYVYERKLSDYFQKSGQFSIEFLNSTLATIRGYDLDPFLTIISHFNLIITSVRVSAKYHSKLNANELLCLKTNVFASVDNNLEGFLEKGENLIVNICTKEKTSLSRIMYDVDYLFTNPPFETIKGMKKELKDYLKKEYPLCKCDLCVAFLLKIVESIPFGARCGLVLQNSWMYLKSYDSVRKVVCDSVALNRMTVLGSGAFTDISGEKASVSLVSLSKTDNKSNMTSFVDLTPYKKTEKESMLRTKACRYKSLMQSSIFGNDGSFNDVIIERLAKCNDSYSKFAIPMQGTSTGDSKRFIDYYWRHLGDSDWKPVSKGGGYSRWYGLNYYVLHWGSDGELIKNTPGSALRNVKYFKDTSMVFSDTGTSGLNVRSLCKGQLFVASGPGIRILSGSVFNHLAFLNSKYASYCIRRFTPKLTIAAGYIARIPVNEQIFASLELCKMGERCNAIKKAICSRRPSDIGFNPVVIKGNLDESAESLMIRELNEELEKINLEKSIDNEIFNIMKINECEKDEILKELDSEIEDVSCKLSIEEIDECLSSVLDSNCILTRTRTSKKSIGCDGPLEYVSHMLHCSPDSIVNVISEHASLMLKTKRAYFDFILHSRILIELGFNRDCCESRSVDVVAASFNDDSAIVSNWIRMQFNAIHSSSLYNKPLYRYDECTDSLMLCVTDVI